MRGRVWKALSIEGTSRCCIFKACISKPFHKRSGFTLLNSISLQERGMTVDKSFKGVFTMGGRMDGMDCAVSSQDINGKVCRSALACINVPLRHQSGILHSVSCFWRQVQAGSSICCCRPSNTPPTEEHQCRISLSLEEAPLHARPCALLCGTAPPA